ncbi:MAG: peptide chain release factor N(5)-glutamine methyltransferase [Anaerolineae bacterium]
MQIRDLQHWANGQIDPADAKYLLQEMLGVSAAWLLAHDDELLPTDQLTHFKKMVQSAAEDDVPIPYLLGKSWFYNRQFNVSPAVLIPRPETEELVQHGLAFLKGKQEQRVIDVGCGSGIIAVTLALETADADHRIIATDISAEALAVAQENGRLLRANVTFQQDNLLKNQEGPFDLIIANLPYIADEEKNVMGASVLKHEPHLALFSDDSGFAHVERLLQQAQTRLAPSGAILLEIGYAQGKRGLELCQRYFPTADCNLLKDLAGHDRILRVVRGETFAVD